MVSMYDCGKHFPSLRGLAQRRQGPRKSLTQVSAWPVCPIGAPWKSDSHFLALDSAPGAGFPALPTHEGNGRSASPPQQPLLCFTVTSPPHHFGCLGIDTRPAATLHPCSSLVPLMRNTEAERHNPRHSVPSLPFRAHPSAARPPSAYGRASAG